MNTALASIADPFGIAGLVDSPSAPPSAPATTSHSSTSTHPVLGPLQALTQPNSPMFWLFGIGAVTFGLIAISHGHIGGEVRAHAGPAHLETGVE